MYLFLLAAMGHRYKTEPVLFQRLNFFLFPIKFCRCEQLDIRLCLLLGSDEGNKSRNVGSGLVTVSCPTTTNRKRELATKNV